MINQVFEGEPLLTYAVALAGWLEVLTYGDTIQETSYNNFLRLVDHGTTRASDPVGRDHEPSRRPPGS